VRAVMENLVRKGQGWSKGRQKRGQLSAAQVAPTWCTARASFE